MSKHNLARIAYLQPSVDLVLKYAVLALFLQVVDSEIDVRFCTVGNLGKTLFCLKKSVILC